MARDFNGTTDRIDWASVFTTSGQALTIGLWAWFDDLNPTGSQYLFNGSKSNGGAGTSFFQQQLSDGKLAFNRNGATVKDRRSALDVVAAGVWTHCLVTDDGSMTAANAHIYVSGAEVPSYTTTTDGATETAATGVWSIGGRFADDLRNLDGRIAEVGVWNRELAAGEIALLAAGYAPIAIPSGLRFWAPVIGSTTEHNRLGDAASTIDGTAIIAHPRVIYPSRTQVLVTPAGGGGPAVGMPEVWAQYRRRFAG